MHHIVLVLDLEVTVVKTEGQIKEDGRSQGGKE